MSLLNAAFGSLWRSARALRRSEPPLETTGDRMFWTGGKIAGVYMSADEALRLSAVWACVTVIAKSLASCQWEVFLEKPNGDRVPRHDTITYELLNRRPNNEMTSFAFREAALIQALIYGNFYAEIEPSAGGLPARLWPMMPDRCHLERNAANELVVRVTNPNREDVYMEYGNVFHLHGPGLDGLAGFDVVNTAARSFAHSAAAERFGQSYYANGTQMGGILSTPATLNGEKQNEIKEQLEARHMGPDQAFRFLLLGGDMKYSALNATPNDAQFIESRQFQIEEVCRWFGVPPHKIAHLLRSTNNNIEHQGIEYTRDALVPWAERMAQEADWKLLPAWRGIKTRLDLDWLAEGDAKSKAETDSILVNAGIRTRNEIRKARGLNTASDENADKLTLQMNMTILEKIAEDPPEPEAPEQLLIEEETPLESAHRELFFNAVRRGLLRQTRRAQQARDAASGADQFFDLVTKSQPRQAHYIGDQIQRVFLSLGIAVDAERVKEILIPMLEEEPGLLRKAYENEDINSWCGINERASVIAAQLVALTKR